MKNRVVVISVWILGLSLVAFFVAKYALATGPRCTAVCPVDYHQISESCVSAENQW